MFFPNPPSWTKQTEVTNTAIIAFNLGDFQETAIVVHLSASNQCTWILLSLAFVLQN
jgi:hypothetical protein